MGNAFLLIVVGLILFYLIISSKWYCVEGFVGCLIGANKGTGGTPNTTLGAPRIPTTPNLQTINNPYPSNVNWGLY